MVGQGMALGERASRPFESIRGLNARVARSPSELPALSLDIAGVAAAENFFIFPLVGEKRKCYNIGVVRLMGCFTY